MQKFQQIIYYNENSDQNFPIGISKDDLVSGRIFQGRIFSQLDIQAPSGTKFYINNGASPVIIGYTGLFQINLTTGCFITNLYFDRDSIDFIKSNDELYLIINMVYEGST